MLNLKFTNRKELSKFEYDSKKEFWKRLEVDKEVLKELNQRSTINGLMRIGIFIMFLLISVYASLYVRSYSWLSAIFMLYIYYFFYGFFVAIGHELQHKTVFGMKFNWLNEIMFFLVQTIMWNSPSYARISHRLHHRYTMVRGIDPETDWPEVITSKWLSKLLLQLILKIFVIGAIFELFNTIKLQILRIIGIKDNMMKNHCSEKDIKVIRIESIIILCIHMGILGLSIVQKRWELLLFITLAWQIGSGIEILWHATEHIGRLYNVNNHILNTRSVKVNPFIKLIFWGLDDHVDHHLFPSIPSKNLPKLHKIIATDLPEPKNMIDCWREMFEIAKEKDSHPENEYVPITFL